MSLFVTETRIWKADLVPQENILKSMFWNQKLFQAVGGTFSNLEGRFGAPGKHSQKYVLETKTDPGCVYFRLTTPGLQVPKGTGDQQNRAEDPFCSPTEGTVRCPQTSRRSVSFPEEYPLSCSV